MEGKDRKLEPVAKQIGQCINNDKENRMILSASAKIKTEIGWNWQQTCTLEILIERNFPDWDWFAKIIQLKEEAKRWARLGVRLKSA